MKKFAYVISVKYAPGSHKEFVLLGRELKKRGVRVRYLLSKYYRWIHKEPLDEVDFMTRSSSSLTILADVIEFLVWRWMWLLYLFKRMRPAFLCFYNVHPLNFAIAKMARVFAPKGIRAIYLHEPARPGKASYGWKGRLFFEMVEFVQALALANSTDVILPSPVAMELFDQHFPDYQGGKHYAPLLIPDRPCRTARKRRYFSMVGRFNFAKRLDMFIDAVNYAAEEGEDLEFQIVTASPIDEYLKKLTPAGKSRIHIVRKDQLPDEDISKAIAESIALLSLQPILTQSGVVPVAFMNSTPVIARPIRGFTQFIKHESNGLILSEDFSSQDLVEAMKSVRNNFERLSANARQSYSDLFADHNWQQYYSWLVDILNPSK